MEVTLYVYDLSRGLARQFSQSFLGTYIDAVYHTAIVVNNREYFFGQGIQTCPPGTTHHGQPMQQISLGKTQRSVEGFLEYLASLAEVYSPESYDLFLHNCNNFSNDFAMFLVGTGIPDHITSLPQTVLNTPFGQMLKPQLDQALRGFTQAPVASSQPVAPNAQVKTNEMKAPTHPHTNFNLPLLQKEYAAVVSRKVPPMDKLLAKLAPKVRSSPVVEDLKSFIVARTNSSRDANTTIPDLNAISAFTKSTIEHGEAGTIFPVVDLIRLALLDVRVSAFFAEEDQNKSLFNCLVRYGSTRGMLNEKTYPALLTITQALSNAFTSPISARCISQSPGLHDFISNCLLQNHYPALRTSLAGLIFNLCNAHHQQVLQNKDENSGFLEDSLLLELLICIVEGLRQEVDRDSKSPGDYTKFLTSSVGFLLYCLPEHTSDDLREVMEAIEAKLIIEKIGQIVELKEMVQEILQIFP